MNKVVCQNKNLGNKYCEGEFTIFPEDTLFYEKIKVPPPTFCPTCRMIRRLSWRNNRSLYGRTCELCSKSLISMYKDDGAPVYCETCYAGDGWDMYAYAQDVDFSQPFLSQLNSLFQKQPRVFSIRAGINVNSDFSNSVVNSKDLYLSFSCIESEKVFYSENVDKSKNTLDSLSCSDLEQCSWNNNSNKNYNSHFLIDSENCIDSLFLYDCNNCSNCFMSSNLRNQSYYFRNQKLDKETYYQKIKDLGFDKYSNLEKYKSELNDLTQNSIHRFSLILASQNSSGDLILNSNNIHKSFDARGCEDISLSYRMVNAKDCMDCGWIMKGEFEYETMTGSAGSYNQAFCFMCLTSRDMQYSISCKNCSDCFGCVGLTNAQYYILNKQYSKEAYFELVSKIKQCMFDNPYIDTKGRVFKYGEFFPYNIALFGYNESLGYDFFPFSKDEIQQLGFNWYERPERAYVITKTSEELPDSILDVSDSIIDDVIGCPNDGDYRTQCTKAFKIHPEELQFLRQKGLPIPRYCPNCRHYERLAYKNPMKLYTRTCSNGCGTQFQTTYAPDRPEKVFCETCYKRAMF